MEEQIPCGGCGAQTASERCIGCLHEFSPPMDKPVANMAEVFSREFDPAPEMFVCMDPNGCYHVSWTEQQHKEKMDQVGAVHETRYVSEARLSEAVEVLEIIAGRRPAPDNLMGNADYAVQFLDTQGGGNG